MTARAGSAPSAPSERPSAAAVRGRERSKLLTAVVLVVVGRGGGADGSNYHPYLERERSNLRPRDGASLRSTLQPDWNQSCPVPSAPAREFRTTLSQSVVYIKSD